MNQSASNSITFPFCGRPSGIPKFTQPMHAHSTAPLNRNQIETIDTVFYIVGLSVTSSLRSVPRHHHLLAVIPQQTQPVTQVNIFGAGTHTSRPKMHPKCGRGGGGGAPAAVSSSRLRSSAGYRSRTLLSTVALYTIRRAAAGRRGPSRLLSSHKYRLYTINPVA